MGSFLQFVNLKHICFNVASGAQCDILLNSVMFLTDWLSFCFCR